MSAAFGPGMIGAVVKVTTTNSKLGETRATVGRLQNYSDYVMGGERPTAMAWFQIEGEPDARIAVDNCHSSEVEVFL